MPEKHINLPEFTTFQCALQLPGLAERQAIWHARPSSVTEFASKDANLVALSSACASARQYALARVGWNQSVRCPLEFGYRLGRRRVAVFSLMRRPIGTGLGREEPLAVAGGESFAATRAGCWCPAGEPLGAGSTA